MKIIAISTPRNTREKQLLLKQHALRADVFSSRLGWEVDVNDGREEDRFDALGPTYILAVEGDDRVTGCARLLPSVGPTMVQDVFPSLLPGGQLNARIGLIESSRFCVDTSLTEGRGSNAIHDTTLSLFAGIIEWCLSNMQTEIVTVTDLRFERILSRVGWPLQRLSAPRRIGITTAVAGTLPVEQSTFQRLRPTNYQSHITIPVSQAA